MKDYWQDIKSDGAKIKHVFDYVIGSIEDMKSTNERLTGKQD